MIYIFGIETTSSIPRFYEPRRFSLYCKNFRAILRKRKNISMQKMRKKNSNILFFFFSLNIAFLTEAKVSFFFIFQSSK